MALMIAAAAALAVAPLAAAQAVTPLRVLPCPGADCLVPDVAQDTSGALHVVYGTSTKLALYQTSADGGATWSRPAQLNPAGTRVTTTMGERGPHLAMSPNGTLLAVAWQDYWSPGAQVFPRLTTSRDGGATWSAPVPASPVPGVDGTSVALDAETGAIFVLNHNINATQDAPVPNATSATWLKHSITPDFGRTWPVYGAHVALDALQPVACSMCQTQVRAVDGQWLLAFRSAVDNMREFWLVNASVAAAGANASAFHGVRVPMAPWYVTECPMNGPVFTLERSTGLVIYTFMSDDANHVHWTAYDPATGRWTPPVGTPSGEGNERYATAVASPAGEVLMVWNVGPMAVTGTALVKYAIYGLADGAVRASGTLGTSFAGTKTTAWLDLDGSFVIMTTARNGTAVAAAVGA